VDANDALSRAGEVEQGNERRGVAPAAVAADRRGARFRDQPRAGGANQGPTAFSTRDARKFGIVANRQISHRSAPQATKNEE
jgi:hypothetical protein